MKKIESIREVVVRLKMGEKVCRNREDVFAWQKEKIMEYRKGSRFVMSLEDFLELYGRDTFFELEESGPEIDSEKDEEYYRYYHK